MPFVWIRFFFKKLMEVNQIPIPDYQIWKPDFKPSPDMTYPVVVKTSHGGSSLGSIVVKDRKSFDESLGKLRSQGHPIFY